MVVRTRRGSLGNVDYVLRDVAGDGHCYYRAVYRLIGAQPTARAALGIAEDATEDDAVVDLRKTVARVLLAGDVVPEANAAIDTLCELAAVSDEIAEELVEMYPFLTEDVRTASRSSKRYRLVANKIAKTPLYASALEHHVFQTLLGPANVSLLVLSAPTLGVSGKRRDIWKKDLRTLLRNTTTRRVAVLLNVANVHYQYFSFKGSDDPTDHTLLSRQKLLALLELTSPARTTAAI